MQLININEVKTYGVVTSPKGYDPKTKTPDPRGLFSWEIFGKTILERSSRFGKIELPVGVFHPIFFEVLKEKERSLIEKVLSNKPYIIHKNQVTFFENPSEASSKGVDPSTLLYGIYSIIKNYRSIFSNTEKPDIREYIIKYDASTLIVNSIPVIPPVFRGDSLEGSTHPLNNLYANLIKYSFRFTSRKLFDEHNPIFGLSCNSIQIMVHEIFLFLMNMYRGKQGILRRNIAGKRIDFSARGVASGDVSVPLDHVKVPVRLLVKIFEPFIIKRFIREFNVSIDDALRIIEKIYYYPHTPELIKEHPEYKRYINVVEEESRDQIVLIKRDPVIHRLGLSAMKVIPSYENTICVNPLETSGFNLDYDGDTVAVFALNSVEAKSQVQKLLNPYHPADPQRLKYTWNKDYSFVFKAVTLDAPEELINLETNSLVKEIWSQTNVNVEGSKYKVTKGLELVFKCLPEKSRSKKVFEDVFYNIWKKNKYLDGGETSTLLLRYLSVEDVKQFLTTCSQKLSEYITYFSECLTLADLITSERINKVFREEITKLKSSSKSDTEFLEKLSSLYKEWSENIVREASKKSSIKKSITTNSVKKVQLLQILLAKGFVEDWKKQVKFITSNIGSGFSEDEFILSGHSARLGIAYRVIKTTEPGVLHRLLSIGLSSVKLSESNLKDCGTTRYINIKNCNKSLLQRLIGRYYVDEVGKLKIITEDDIPLLEGKSIDLRSPITCKSPQICFTCYGEGVNFWNTKEIGLLAGLSIGERMYQEMMKVFHLGGVTQVSFFDPFEFMEKELKMDTRKIKSVLEYNPSSKKMIIKGEDFEVRISTELFEDLAKTISKIDEPVSVEVSELIVSVKTKDGEEDLLFVPGRCMIFVEPHNVIGYDRSEDPPKIVLKFISSDKGKELISMLPSKGGIDRSIMLWKLIVTHSSKLPRMRENELLMLMFNAVKDLGKVALVHYEVLLSHLLRYRQDIRILARLHSPYDPVLVPITKTIQLDHPLLGGFFSDMKKNIKRGVISSTSTVSFHNLDNTLLRVISGEE